MQCRCKNKARWLVNARYREAQLAVCGVHLAQAVEDMANFNDRRYKRRVSDTTGSWSTR